MMDVPKLVQVEPAAGEEIVLEGELQVGREDAEVILDDPEASRRHAVLANQGGTVTVRDLDSRNGTFVNGKAVAGEMELAQGDLLKIGGTRLARRAPAAGSRRAAAEAPAAEAPAAKPRAAETVIASRADIDATRGAVPRPAPAAGSAVSPQPAFAPAAGGSFAPPAAAARRSGRGGRPAPGVGGAAHRGDPRVLRRGPGHRGRGGRLPRFALSAGSGHAEVDRDGEGSHRNEGEGGDVGLLLHPRVDPRGEPLVLGRGLPAGPPPSPPGRRRCPRRCAQSM